MKRITMLVAVFILSLGIIGSSVQVFASDNGITPRFEDGGGAGNVLSQKTTRVEYDYGATFESTIRHDGTTWSALRRYGVTTLFNQSRSYYDDGLIQGFYYSGMGQVQSQFFTQVNDAMYHYY